MADELNLSSADIIPKILPDIIDNLPPETVSGVATLITILQAVSIAFIIYLIFAVINIIMNIKRNKRIKDIHIKVDEINKKIDGVLGKNKSKEHKENKNK